MLRLEGVRKEFPAASAQQENVIALDDIHLCAEPGEFLAVIGPSGCGKSTLLEIVAGLESPTSGAVFVDGDRVIKPHSEIGVVFQSDSTLPWLTSVENVEFGLKHRGYPKAERREIAREMLELVGLAGFQNHRPGQLSGGMRQRVALARALATSPKLLLMDEPFGALDEQTRLLMGDELLRIWRETGSTILFVTHSLSEAALLASRVVVLTGHPGRLKAIEDNPIPRPRSSDAIGSPEFLELTGKLWKLLKTDAVDPGEIVRT